MAATYLTVDNIKTLVTERKGNLGNFTDTNFIQWANYINQYVYPQFVSINPNQYLTNWYLVTESGINKYRLAEDFKMLAQGGLYYTQFDGNDVPQYFAINFDAQTSPYTVGSTLTGVTSGATGVIYAVSDKGTSGTIILTGESGTFVDNELLTDGSGGSAMSNGAGLPYAETDRAYAQTDFGSPLVGYWISQEGGYYYLNLTGNNDVPRVIIARYTPFLSKLTTTTGTTGTTLLLTPDFDEFAVNAAIVYWEQVRDNPDGEILGSQRYKAALDDMMANMNTIPTLLMTPDKRRIYGRIRRGTYRNA
jgi:hypothetical protein